MIFTNLNIHLKIVGLLLLGLAAVNACLPRYFGWRKEMAQVSLVTRQIFYVHCFFIGLLLTMVGFLSLFCTDLLVQPSPLARAILLGLTIFWSARLLTQFFIYKPAIWKGDNFRTAAHIFFGVMWAYYVFVFGAGLWYQLAR